MDIGTIAMCAGCFVAGGIVTFGLVATYACLVAGSDADDGAGVR